MIMRLLLCVTLLLIGGSANAVFAREFNFEDGIRHYRLHLPPGKPTAGMPLVVVLHGGGQNGGMAAYITRMSEEADRNGFAVLYPDGSGRFKRFLLTWNAFDCCGFSSGRKVHDSKFVAELVDSVVRQYRFDCERVYLSGFSNGGMLAYRLACEYPEKFAAAAIIGGSMSGKENRPQQPVSILIVHGTSDRHVPYAGGTGKLAKWGYPVNKKSVAYATEFWRQVNGCAGEAQVATRSREKWLTFKSKVGADVVVCTIEGARHAWPGGRKLLLYTDRPYRGFSASHECWQFFSSQSRSQVAQTAQITEEDE